MDDRGTIEIGWGEPTFAALRVAEKLGFRVVGRHEGVIVERLRPRGDQPG